MKLKLILSAGKAKDGIGKINTINTSQASSEEPNDGANNETDNSLANIDGNNVIHRPEKINDDANNETDNSLANIEDNKVTPKNFTVNNEEKRQNDIINDDEQNINIVPTQVDKNAR